MVSPANSQATRTGMMVVLIVHLALVLLALLEFWPLAAQAARLSFCLVCLLGLANPSLREISLLTLALILGGVLLASGQGAAPINRALDLAAFFSAFIVLLTLIKVAAERSPSVERVGRYLTSQPQGRRYLATSFGSHALGVFLNFAAISLMSPLIQRSATHPDGTKHLQLEQRQLSAMIRGFSWVIMWAPTTLTVAVISSLFPQANWFELLPYGVLSAVVMIMVGWAIDRQDWRRVPAQHATSAPVFPRKAFGVLGTICLLFILLTVMLQSISGLSVAKSLMYVAPIMTLGWFAGLQGESGQDGQRAGLSLLLPAFRNATPGFVASATTLGLSGLVGILAGEAVPIDAIAQWYDITSLPEWLVLAALPVLITLGGQAALSPILVVVFLGQLLNSMPVLPADPVHIMFSLSAGWALSMALSPNASATLLMSSITRIPPTRLTWEWNMKYGLVCYGLFVAAFYALSHG